ncbi:MAG: acyl carrier protein [Planctomycetes bacterium]|nr:acyl carrier protein [Planctomycetota bacterium]NQU48977.1 acyl carrier protein [Planctomycetota bacterium]
MTANTPNHNEIVTRLAGRLAELLRLESTDSIKPESELRKDLGVDSLGLVDLVTLVEEDFSVRFASNTDLSEIVTVNDVANLVESRIQAAQQA